MELWTEVGKGHSFGSIHAKAFRSRNAIINEKFDLGIFFGTFESRGLVSSNLLQKNSCKHSVIVFFKEAQDTSLRKKYDPALTSQVGKCSREDTYTINNISIKEIEKILEKLLSWVPADCWKSEASWFIDLGGSPIPYFLGLLGYLHSIQKRFFPKDVKRVSILTYLIFISSIYFLGGEEDEPTTNTKCTR